MADKPKTLRGLANDALGLNAPDAPYPGSHNKTPLRKYDHDLHDEAVRLWGPPGKRSDAVNLRRTVPLDEGDPGVAGYFFGKGKKGSKTRSKTKLTSVRGLANPDPVFREEREKYGPMHVVYQDTRRGGARGHELPAGQAVILAGDGDREKAREAVVHEELHLNPLRAPAGTIEGEWPRRARHGYIEPYLDFLHRGLRGEQEAPPLKYRGQDIPEHRAKRFSEDEYRSGARYYPGQSYPAYVDQRLGEQGYGHRTRLSRKVKGAWNDVVDFFD